MTKTRVQRKPMRKMAYGGDPYSPDTYQSMYNGVVGAQEVSPAGGRAAISGMAGGGQSGGSAWSRAAGGTAAAGNAAGAVGAASQLGIGLVNAIDSPNAYGNPSTVGTTATGALSGAAAGAVAGSVVPGIGTAIGAVAGAVIGGVTGLIKGKKMRKKEKDLFNKAIEGRRKYDEAVSQAIQQDPTLINGNQGASYYANGGVLGGSQLKMLMTGGSATSLNSNAVEFNGRSHANGGIKIPALGAEVEGGETMAGDYVFSKRLGFAQMHKPIAKAIARIEEKPQTEDRVNALKLLRRKENSLALAQETLKSVAGIS